MLFYRKPAPRCRFVLNRFAGFIVPAADCENGRRARARQKMWEKKCWGDCVSLQRAESDRGPCPAAAVVRSKLIKLAVRLRLKPVLPAALSEVSAGRSQSGLATLAHPSRTHTHSERQASRVAFCPLSLTLWPFCRYLFTLLSLAHSLDLSISLSLLGAFLYAASLLEGRIVLPGKRNYYRWYCTGARKGAG